MHPVTASLCSTAAPADPVPQLRSHPLAPGADCGSSGPSARRVHGTLLDRLCAGSAWLTSPESVQPPPEKGPPHSTLRSQPSHVALPGPRSHLRTRSSHGQQVSAAENHPTQMKQAPAWSTSGVPPWSTQTRPLSDIRELTEPSLLSLANRKALPPDPPGSGVTRKCSLTRKGSLLSRKSSPARRPSTKGAPSPAGSRHSEQRRGRPSPFRTPVSDRSSVYSIPISNVPPRSSSQNRENRARSAPRGSSLPPAPPRGLGYTIPNRGLSTSPVREIAARLDPVSSDVVQTIPPRTFARVPSSEMLEFPTHRHPRVSVDIHLGAPLFVGGGSLEGNVKITVEDAERQRHKRALAIARISVDLLGVEDMWNAKRDIFLNLATELIDSENPPPDNMVDSRKHISPLDPFWLLTPSTTTMPFSLSLPLDIGPPPFQSKLARIRYVLCCTLLVRDKGVQYLVRTSQEVSVLSVYDPEKALMSLPSPLTASDEYTRPRESSIEVIRVTAGLHRQVWVSGTSIFVDVHIANNSRKAIRKLELQLERDILCYKHTAASTMEKSASQARIFDSNERTVLAKASIKQGLNGWSGVAAHTHDTRTCDLELPRGHATVKCGKFFEVRYFLNINVSSTHTKLVTVQLPIVLIHMNSLDVVPNSVAQVAAAIEEKRGPSNSRSRHHRRRASASVQGRAFAAPRMHSLDRIRSEAEDLQHIGRTLERSPRKYKPATKYSTKINPNGSTSIQNEHVIRRVQSATPEIVDRTAGHKSSSDNIGVNGAVGLGYGYRSSYNLISGSDAYDGDQHERRDHRYQHSGSGYETPPNRKGLLAVDTSSVESMGRRVRRVHSDETTRSHHTERSASAGHGYKITPHHIPPPQPGLQQLCSIGGHVATNSSSAATTSSNALPPAHSYPGFREAEVSGGASGPTGHKGHCRNPSSDAVDLGSAGSGGGYPGGAASGSAATVGLGPSVGPASFKARLDAARDRQWRFQGVSVHGSHHAHGHAYGMKKWRGLPERGLEWIMGDKEEREKEKEKERRRAMDNWI